MDWLDETRRLWPNGAPADCSQAEDRGVEAAHRLYVCELDRPWLETPFLTQGFPLLKDSDISVVQKHCLYVYADVERSRQQSLERIDASQPKLAAAQNPAPAVAETAPAPKRPGILSRLIRRRAHKPVTQELTVPIQRALKVSRDTSDLVRTVFDDVRLGNSIDTPQAKEVVSRCVEEVIENPDAMLLLTNIKKNGNYTAEHSLNVAVLSIVLGKQLGFGREKTRSVCTRAWLRWSTPSMPSRATGYTTPAAPTSRHSGSCNPRGAITTMPSSYHN